jgi:hypothetical protein
MPILMQMATTPSEEFWLKIPVTAADGNCMVISGYAKQNAGIIKGDSSSDYTLVDYTLRLTIGPEWDAITDVSPTVTPSGFAHFDSDDADATGYELTGCRWEPVPGTTPGTKRIRLEVDFFCRGGPAFTLTTLAYHVVARGKLHPG